MVTGAASATINHVPVLLLAGDAFAERVQSPVLQQLEWSGSQDTSANDAFRPVVRYWDRINRPEQLITALPEVMRILTSPADTGAVFLGLPQDIQTYAFDFPVEMFEKRIWSIPRNRPDRNAVATAAEWIRASRRPRHLRRWRRPLQRGDRCPARVRGADRDPRRGDARRQGRPCPTTIR